MPSAAPSDDEEEDELSRNAHKAPLEALAEAAAVASDELQPDGSTLFAGRQDELLPGSRRRKRTKGAPAPPNAFPDVVTKGLVSDELAREIYAL